MDEKKMICPNCKEKLDKINIDYVASINRTFDIENEELYWHDFEDKESIDDIYMIYCDKCKNELPHELMEKIKGFKENY